MLDGAVSFDIERYAEVPDRLARVARDLEAAAELLVRSGEPAGANAAAAVDAFAGWVRREQGRAADRWARILAIPGFDAFDRWEHRPGGGSFVWDVDWVTRTDGDLHSYEELVALATVRGSLSALLGQVEREEPLDRDEVDAALAALAAIDEPAVASALLDALGAGGFRRLHGILAATTDPTDAGDVERLEEGIGMLTGLFATASRATGRDQLSEAFLDDFVGTPAAGATFDGPVPVAPPPPNAVDTAQEVFAGLDFGREVAARLAAVAGPTGALVVLERAGTAFAVISAAMPLVELVQHGPLSGEFAGTSITSGLGLAGFLSTSTPVTFACFAAASIVSLIVATGEGGTPPGLVLSPDVPNPGGSHYPYFVDETGTPAAPS